MWIRGVVASRGGGKRGTSCFGLQRVMAAAGRAHVAPVTQEELVHYIVGTLTREREKSERIIR